MKSTKSYRSHEAGSQFLLKSVFTSSHLWSFYPMKVAFTCEAKVSDCSVLAVSLSRNRRDESPAPPPPIGAVGKARCPLRNLHFSFSFSPEPSLLRKSTHLNQDETAMLCHVSPPCLFVPPQHTMCQHSLYLSSKHTAHGKRC